MNNFPKLFINISDLEICLIAGHSDDQSSFEILEKLNLPIEGISENKITDLNIIANLIKKIFYQLNKRLIILSKI